MPNMKSLSLMVQKLWPRLKFAIIRIKVTVKVTGSSTLVSIERVSLVDYACQI